MSHSLRQTQLRYLGTSCFEFATSDGRRAIIDPYISGSRAAPIELKDLVNPALILVTHGGFDHVGDAFELARRSGGLLAGSADVALAARAIGLEHVFPMVSGAWREHEGFRVQAVEARHVSITDLGDGKFISGQPLGFVLWPYAEHGQPAVYHSGDTSVFGDMSLIASLYKPTVALVCVGGPRDLPQEMSPTEAALAVEFLCPSLAIPMHWIPGSGDAEAFQAAVERRGLGTEVHVMQPGDVLDLDA